MQIRIDNPEKCFPSRLKKYFQSNIGYKTYCDFVPNVRQQILGNLPPEIIKLFPMENKNANIKEFQNSFGEFICKLRDYYCRERISKNLTFNAYSREMPQDLIDFNDIVTRFFNSFIQDSPLKDKIKGHLQFIDYGAFGSVFKISLLNLNGEKICHDKALKVYYRNIINQKLLNRGHGLIPEANFWTFLQHTVGHDLGKTQFTKFYMSDLKNGYTMTEFIDTDIPKTTSFFNYYEQLRLSYTDFKNNPPKFGKICDVGGFITNSDMLIEDKVIRKYFKKLYNRNSQKDLEPVLEALQREGKNPKNEHRDKIKKALDIFLAMQNKFDYRNR